MILFILYLWFVNPLSVIRNEGPSVENPSEPCEGNWDEVRSTRQEDPFDKREKRVRGSLMRLQDSPVRKRDGDHRTRQEDSRRTVGKTVEGPLTRLEDPGVSEEKKVGGPSIRQEYFHQRNRDGDHSARLEDSRELNKDGGTSTMPLGSLQPGGRGVGGLSARPGDPCKETGSLLYSCPLGEDCQAVFTLEVTSFFAILRIRNFCLDPELLLGSGSGIIVPDPAKNERTDK